MSHFLLRQAAKVIAGSAAPQVASQIAQRLTTPATRDEDRRRFLIWLAGPFKQSQPEAYDRLWPRLSGKDETVNALTGVFLELQTAGPSAMMHWFTQLAESDQQHFDELIAAMQPKQPDTQKLVKQASKEAESTFRGAARFLGRTYRKTNQSRQEQRRRKR
ncbi:MAG: hypothetical protein OXD50_09765 [Chloroflexi bacterium]|nr:hypothetical protein [Chloroflexota bacterium]